MKIALWQTHPKPDIDTALNDLAQAVGQAAQAGADLMVTPEMCLGGYAIGPTRIQTHAAQADRICTAVSALAAQHGIALVVGLTTPAEPRPHNTCIAFDATGAEVARYHKTHLFADLDRSQFSAGAALSDVFMLCGWRVGLAICYDIEFPELARALAVKGAEIIVTPTANMVPYDTVSTRLVPARAQENAIHIAYCNFVGPEADLVYNGLSCVCGPDGMDLARGDTDTPDMLFATLDPDAIATTRRDLTYLADRRPDLYGDIT